MSARDNDEAISGDAPLVSINIVTRNRRDALKKAIESVFKQTYAPMELVVVDNDSSDGSADMVEQEWPNVRVIRIHRNIGCQPGRNIGMKNCRGKYIFNLDDDGWLHPEAIQRIVQRFEMDEGVALIMAAVEVPEDKTPYKSITSKANEQAIGTFVGAAHAIRASVLSSVGYFPEYPRGNSEPNLSLRLIEARWELLYLPSAVMYHDLSDIERNRNNLHFYQVAHDLENIVRLYPLAQVPLELIWKTLLHAFVAVKQKTLWGYLLGNLRFYYRLPVALGERKAVSTWAVQKQRFLRSRSLVTVEESRSFSRYSLWATMRERFGRRFGRQSKET